MNCDPTTDGDDRNGVGLGNECSSMEIFFSGSIRGGRSDRDRYAELIHHLDTHGTVLTEHIAEPDVEQKEAAEGLTDTDIYEQDMAWLRRADILVAEVTQPSVGVGYEVGRAAAMGTPTLCLYHQAGDHDCSAMIRGNDGVELLAYEALDTAKDRIDTFCEQHG